MVARAAGVRGERGAPTPYPTLRHSSCPTSANQRLSSPAQGLRVSGFGFRVSGLEFTA